MSQSEIKAAIAEQEEHIKRSTSCRGAIGVSHAYRTHGRPRTQDAPDASWSACVVCGVTETSADYAIKIGRSVGSATATDRR